MASPIPSRRALRHLSRLCRRVRVEYPSSSLSLSLSKCSVRSVHNGNSNRARHPTLLVHKLENRAISPSIANAASLPCHSARSFSSAPNRHIQPSSDPKTEEQDPQNRSSPALPDITNYYTLFPQTLPHGPPGQRLATVTGTITGTDPAAAAPPAQEVGKRTSKTIPKPEFYIHPPTLRKEFLQLQSRHHPDKYPPGTPAHQKSLALSALINAAYKTLSDPLLRAQYLLSLQYGIDVTAEDGSGAVSGETGLAADGGTDQETLLSVMEAQEAVEMAETEAEVEQLKAENDARIRQCEGVLGAALETDDVETARTEAVRLKFWRSLQGAMHEWEPGKEVRLVH